MNKTVTHILALATVSGALLGAKPAEAASYGIGLSIPGISFSYSSGGYCDAFGCPDYFWNYPIYYCPVYYGGNWYRGPVYYRIIFGQRYFWIHGDWRRDSWFRPRPVWACVDRFGPPLDLDFYIWNGFTVRDDWRYAWRSHRDDWWRHRHDWDREHRNDTSWRAWVPPAQRNYDWNRERDWNKDRDWTKPGWNRSDWERRNHIDRGTNVPPTVINPPARTPPPFRERQQPSWQKGGRDHQWGGSQGGPSQPGAGQPSGQSGVGRSIPPSNTPGGRQPDKHQVGGQNWSGGQRGTGDQSQSGPGQRSDKDQRGHGRDRNDKGSGPGGP